MHVTKIETLEEAYRVAKGNGGAPGIDGQSFADIESAGRGALLAAVWEDLLTGRYQPMPNRRVEIPKGNGKVRTLQIPCIRDSVVQGADLFDELWRQRTDEERAALRRLARSDEPAAPDAAALQLVREGYVVKRGDGVAIAVPLFRAWIADTQGAA